MKRYLLFLSLAVILNARSQNIWEQKSSIPINSYFSISFVIDEYAYVGLGSVDFENGIYTSKMFRYDAGNNTWDTITPFPGGGRYGATAFSIDGKGYVCLGFDDSYQLKNDVWQYDPVADSWLQLDSFPGTGRYHAGVFVLGNKAYIMGGSANSGYNYLNDLWCFDPSDTSWTQKAPIPVDHKAIAVGFSINGKGYFVSGSDVSGSATKDFWEYNPDDGLWTSMPDMCYETAGAVQFIIQGNIFTGTGTDYNETFKSFCVYDTVAGYWTEAIYPPPEFSTRYGASSFTIGNKGYVVGGRADFSVYNSEILNDMWAMENVSVVAEKGCRDLSISPNPCKESVVISTPRNSRGPLKILVLNSLGQPVLNSNNLVVSGDFSINLSTLSNGNYLIELIDNDGINYSSPLIISR